MVCADVGSEYLADIAGAALPLQRVETSDELRSRALMWSGRKLEIASLLNEYQDKVVGEGRPSRIQTPRAGQARSRRL